MRLLLAACLLAAVTTPTYASNYANGTYSDGYVYQNGYWYLGTQAYSRASVPYTYQKWDGYGHCYRSYIAYKWAYTPYVAPAVSYKDPDYRTKLLAIAEQRDRFILNQRKDAIDQNNFIETVRELGLNGNFAVQGYGNQVSYANPLRFGGTYGGHYGVAAYGNNGSTAYGYSYDTIRDLYGKADLSVLQNQYARSTENAQTLADRAVGGLRDLLETDGASRERVAALLAKGQIMSRLAETLETPAARTQTSVKQYSLEPAAPSPAVDRLNDLSSIASRYQAEAKRVIDANCISCHFRPKNDSEKPKGGLDLTDPFSLSVENQKRIVHRSRHSSQKEPRMPLVETGEEGEPLTNAELRALMNAFEN